MADDRPAHILLIDDDRGMTKSLEAALMGRGFRVTLAQGGAEALAMFRLDDVQSDFDLVITDYLMPNVNGLELADMIFRIDPQLPVVLITAYSDADLRRRAEDLGVVHILEKPFTPSALLDLIHNCLTEMAFFGDHTDQASTEANER
jgi:DNA-binding NtrC family response regulator